MYQLLAASQKTPYLTEVFAPYILILLPPKMPHLLAKIRKNKDTTKNGTKNKITAFSVIKFINNNSNMSYIELTTSKLYA